MEFKRLADGGYKRKAGGTRARLHGRVQVLDGDRRWKCGGGKQQRSEDITTVEKCVCMCVFALLQWPHLPLHPVREAQSCGGGGVGSPPSASDTHTHMLSLWLIHTLHEAAVAEWL